MKAGYREKNGKLEYRFSYQGRQYSVIGATEKECREKKDKRIRELSMGLKIDAKKITFKEYTKEWLNSKHIKQSSIHSYEKKLKMVSALDDKKMVEIDRRDIISLQSSLSKKYATSTTNWLIVMVRHIFESAIADEIVLKNPCAMVKAIKRTEPKATETIHRALSKNEQEKFIGYCHEHKMWYTELYEFMLVTGVRVGEAGALTWADVDGAITISKTIARISNKEYAVQSTKTDAGNRVLPLTEDAKVILSKQKIKVAEHKGIKYTAADMRVFYGFFDCSCINPSKVDSAIGLVCEKTHLDRFTSHAFRDTYATRCIQQGMQPNTLKKLMGHTKISITMDLYAQVMPEDLDEAMSKISIL